ncbi:Dihydroorotate dehydrogenase B (NAD(+)), electron transfer subunit [Paraliobacillus sp. PM-2]|uniref:dihydroorotate dehydrogenase electron transfer subunit n=1 Tax=Paraliobacillus sp. PM-2 TaxID=1462524 RepID=UPI00061B8D0A|nr:dihydroorotate dehydrogenase electron transfer subunit [Paraliobacillus sp. PM-2]CQR47762.1 Dihydroorotate dehydrogenase B (NAD(+)), electron transfer subunit [Paraliobacillus sp. PM-2]
MIRKANLTIAHNEKIAKSTFLMHLLSEESTLDIQPGQFIHIKIGQDHTHMLRRPISIADVDHSNQIIKIIFKTVGEGTGYLSKQKTGDKIDALLPCGSSYPIDKLTMKHALLIGGGIGVPPLYYLAKQLVNRGVSVTSILGFQTASQVFFEEEFQALGKVYIATNDGSYGYSGFVTDIYQAIQPSFDYYFSCGPTPMLKGVTKELEDKPGYISLEERMGCGVGACFACVLPSRDGGYKKICQHGPVFDANEVILA